MTINEIINKVTNAKSFKAVQKYADKLDVKLGNIKDLVKAKNKVITSAARQRNDVIREVEMYKQKAYDKALKRYYDKAMKHNEKALRMTYEAMQQLGRITPNVQNYLQGKELDLSTRSGITYQRSNSPFALEDFENIEFADIKSINKRIRTLESQDKKLTKAEIKKNIVNNKVSKQAFEKKLQGYVDSGDITDNDKDLLMSKINDLNGLQQEIFMNNVVNSMPDKYPKASKEEAEEINVNLVNKLSQEIDTVKTFL